MNMGAGRLLPSTREHCSTGTLLCASVPSLCSRRFASIQRFKTQVPEVPGYGVLDGRNTSVCHVYSSPWPAVRKDGGCEGTAPMIPSRDIV